LFKYAALRHPEHASVIAQVLSIPPKRHQKRQISFLTSDESRALIDAPDQSRWEGRRDRAMLTLTIQAGRCVAFGPMLRRKLCCDAGWMRGLR
jgi:site-specific recombinase XerD